MPQPMSGVFPGMFPFGGAQFGGLGGMPAQAMTQQVWFGFHYTSRSQVL
jgi:splicing factor U2AF subunit